jgi:hypothetical protein
MSFVDHPPIAVRMPCMIRVVVSGHPGTATSTGSTTPSQVIRRLIRGYIEERLGRPWQPGEQPAPVQAAAKRRARHR